VLTVTEPAHATGLTTLTRLKAELGLTDVDAARDAKLAEWILEASDAIVAYVGHVLAREAVEETFIGLGRTDVLLERTPIVAVSAVTLEGEVIDPATYRVADAETGVLYRVRDVWTDTRGRCVWLTPGARTDRGADDWAAAYVGGYLLPDDDVVAPISADGADRSYNDANAGFPLAASGEWITASGFSTAANNGRRRVLSRTASKIVVDAALATEAVASGLRYLRVCNLPRVYEQACLMLLKMRWAGRTPGVTSERIGDWAATYADPGDTGGLPPEVAAMLSQRVF
jgi:hypothetical protein